MAIAESIVNIEIPEVEELAVYHLEGINREPVCLDYIFSNNLEIPEQYLGDHVIHLINTNYFGNRNKEISDPNRIICKICPKASGMLVYPTS